MKLLQFLMKFLFVGMLGLCFPLQAMEDDCVISFEELSDQDDSIIFLEELSNEEFGGKSFEDFSEFIADMMNDFCIGLNDETLNDTDRKELFDEAMSYNKFFNHQLTPEQAFFRSRYVMDIFLQKAERGLDCQEEMYVDLLKKIKKCTSDVHHTSKEMMITLLNKALLLIRDQNVRFKKAVVALGKEFLTQAQQGTIATVHQLVAMASVYGPQAIPMMINLIQEIAGRLSVLGKGLKLIIQLSSQSLVLYGPDALDLLSHLMNESIAGLNDVIDFLIDVQKVLLQQLVSGAINHAPQIKAALMQMIRNIGGNLASLKQMLLTMSYNIKFGMVAYGPQAVAALIKVMQGIGNNLKKLQQTMFVMMQNIKHGIVTYGPQVRASMMTQGRKFAHLMKNVVTTHGPQICQMTRQIIKNMKDRSIDGLRGLKNILTSLLQKSVGVMKPYPVELASFAVGILCAYENIASVSDLSLSNIATILGSVGVVTTFGYVTKKLHQCDIKKILFRGAIFCAATALCVASLYAEQNAFDTMLEHIDDEISFFNTIKAIPQELVLYQKQVIDQEAISNVVSILPKVLAGAVGALMYITAKKAHKTLCDIEQQEAEARKIIKRLEGFVDYDLVVEMFEQLSLAQQDNSLSNSSKRELAKIASSMRTTVATCSNPQGVMNHLLLSWAKRFNPNKSIVVEDESSDSQESLEDESFPLADQIKQRLISFVEHNRADLTTLLVALTSRAGYQYVSDADCGLNDTMRVLLVTAFFVMPMYIAYVLPSNPAMAFSAGNMSMYTLAFYIAMLGVSA